MNTNQVINKLQLGLKQKGYIVTVHRRQNYSVERGRFYTTYTIYRDRKKLHQSHSAIVIIKYLATILDYVKTLNSSQLDSRGIDTRIEKEVEKRWQKED